MNDRNQDDKPTFQIGQIEGGIINVGGQMSIDSADVEMPGSGRDREAVDPAAYEKTIALLADLRRKIVTYLSLEEVQTLCFDLGLSYEALPGDGLSSRVIALLKHCHRRNQLDALRSSCRALNDSVDW